MARAVGAVIEIQGAGTERTRTDGIIRQPAELHVLQRGRGVEPPLPQLEPREKPVADVERGRIAGVNVGEGSGIAHEGADEGLR